MNFCCNLQRGVIALAIIDIILNILFIALWGYILEDVADKLELDPEVHGKADLKITEIIESKTAALCIVYVVSRIFKICFAIYLGNAVRTNNLRFCLMWLYFSGVLLIFGTIVFMFEVAFYGTPLTISIGCIDIFYKIFEMWIVNCFVQELRSLIVPGTL